MRGRASIHFRPINNHLQFKELIKTEKGKRDDEMKDELIDCCQSFIIHQVQFTYLCLLTVVDTWKTKTRKRENVASGYKVTIHKMMKTVFGFPEAGQGSLPPCSFWVCLLHQHLFED